MDNAGQPTEHGEAAASVDLLEAIRLQAEEHPLIDDKDAETLVEKCLHLIHNKAYDEAVKHAGGRDVLDVGCNTGYGTVRFVGTARSVTGVDVSAAAVEAARVLPGAETARFEVIDGLGLPFPDDSFDLITSFQVVEHVLDPVPYLNEIKRVLRPGGIALLTTPNAAIRLDPGMTPWNRFHVREYRAPELKVALEEVFPRVEVLGMFGVPTLYNLEIDRVDANRRNARKRQAAAAAKEAAAEAAARAAAEPAPAPAPAPAPTPQPSFATRAKRKVGRTSVGRWARGVLRGTPAPAKAAPAPAAPAPAPVVAAPEPETIDFREFTVGDLFYSARDLDKAMDLMAVCRLDG